MKSEYPIIFEIMGNIPIELSPKQKEFYNFMGFPIINENSCFNEYFFTLIIGFGSGDHIADFIGKNIIRKFKLGFLRKNDMILPKKGILIYHMLEIILENLKKIQKYNFKEKFTSGLILWNYSNFILIVSNQFKVIPELEIYYEKFLRECFEIFSGFFKNADKDNLKILQTLKIEAKMSVLYKEHMRLIFKKEKIRFGLDKEIMKANSTRYYFQKRLGELFDFPEKNISGFPEMQFPKFYFSIDSFDLNAENHKIGN